MLNKWTAATLLIASAHLNPASAAIVDAASAQKPAQQATRSATERSLAATPVALQGIAAGGLERPGDTAVDGDGEPKSWVLLLAGAFLIASVLHRRTHAMH